MNKRGSWPADSRLGQPGVALATGSEQTARGRVLPSSAEAAAEGGGSPWQSPTEPPESWRAGGAVRGHWEARVWEAALGPGGLPLSAHLRIGLTKQVRRVVCVPSGSFSASQRGFSWAPPPSSSQVGSKIRFSLQKFPLPGTCHMHTHCRHGSRFVFLR